MISRDRDHWVKVEFYGLPPDGQVVTDVNLQEIAGNLATVFGFEYVDGLTVVQADPVRDLRRRLGEEHQRQNHEVYGHDAG